VAVGRGVEVGLFVGVGEAFGVGLAAGVEVAAGVGVTEESAPQASENKTIKTDKQNPTLVFIRNLPFCPQWTWFAGKV